MYLINNTKSERSPDFRAVTFQILTVYWAVSQVTFNNIEGDLIVSDAAQGVLLQLITIATGQIDLTQRFRRISRLIEVGSLYLKRAKIADLTN